MFATHIERKQSNKSNSWVRGNVGETASVSVSKSDVTSFTPRSTPRVLNEPSTVFETNEEDTVVERSSAVVEDTVGVETPVRGIDSDGNRLLEESSLEIINASGSDILESIEVIKAGSWLLASSLGSSVGVVRFSGETVSLNVFESSVHHTTVATIVPLRAVNELLFG